MPRSMPCPHCAKVVGIPGGITGLLKCPHCSKAFDPMPVAKAIAPAVEDDEEDEDDEDDEDDENDEDDEEEESEDEGKKEAKTMKRIRVQSIIFLCLGFLGFVGAVSMDTTQNQVHNIGLLNVRQNLVIASGFFLVIGTMYELFILSRK